MEENVIRAYSEISCLLEYFPKSHIERLPSELLKQIKDNCNSKYFIRVDTNKTLDKQNISEETKNMLVVLKYNYWSKEDERKQIEEKLQYNEDKYLREQREKYNPDNLFRNKKTEKIVNRETQALVKYNEKNFIQKIFDRLKDIFMRK